MRRLSEQPEFEEILEEHGYEYAPNIKSATDPNGHFIQLGDRFHDGKTLTGFCIKKRQKGRLCVAILQDKKKNIDDPDALEFIEMCTC